MFSNYIFFIHDGIFIIFKFVYRPLINSFVFNNLVATKFILYMNYSIKFIYLLWNLNFINCTMSLNFKALVNNLVGTKVQD
jgi:hypothetical protein